MSVKVLIADDQALVRVGFRMLLDAESDIDVVGEATNGLEAVDKARRLRPDVVLMDVRMPELDGLEATRRVLADADATARVLVLTTFDLDEYVYDALRAGASGFLLKDVPPADLLSGIRAVAGGDAVVAPSITRRLIDTFTPHLPDPATGRTDERLDRLTDREHEVLVLVARGSSNTEIAATLTLSEATVKAHVGRLLAKLGVRDRVQLVVFAYEAGVVNRGEA